MFPLKAHRLLFSIFALQIITANSSIIIIKISANSLNNFRIKLFLVIINVLILIIFVVVFHKKSKTLILDVIINFYIFEMIKFQSSANT